MTPTEFESFRRSWAVTYRRLMADVREAKMAVRVANRDCELNWSAVNETTLNYAHKVLKQRRTVMSNHLIQRYRAQYALKLYYDKQKADKLRQSVIACKHVAKEIPSEILAQLEKFKPICVVLRRDQNGKILGVVENSWSMDWMPTRACIFWSGTEYSFLGEHKLNGVASANHNRLQPDAVVFDALSEECPIDIDWAHWLEANKAMNKFAARNAAFTEKQVYITTEGV